ncbi:serine-aspartate repeat-containing protein I-like isoform X1 [Pangasianodon hypophthalmus]|uniref:serine-aspartate repeat-containing protein I-like isoform X1 n=2 Tax=Pangasianodon hypophthalmus TaxID=310915 RepID=UPI002307F090|nr:serine-aspartate repeat-containing protein I-like isoform X1 [Pangasianodon hypophthalmus]XP_053084219.1 serine-aspartate repeat-containing protein I-like isoform X1 [Pangasianodon hypophthalmus]XP_053084220.1 serine-aspartate repeat-containing protein I-like isoform X1 [Pangasianodon hypophthalmus]
MPGFENMYRTSTSSLQRKPKKSAPCPLCGVSFRNVRQHLIKLHKVLNKMELRILLQYTSGTYNGLNDCPICKRSNFVRLDKHMKLCHSDMTEVQQKELLTKAKKQTNLLDLKTLRAKNPSPPLVSTLDVEMLAESDDETSSPQQSIMAQKDVITHQVAPHQGPEEGDTREREDTAPTTQPNCKGCKVQKAVVKQLKEEINTLKNKNPFPLRRKYERRNTVQTELPVFEKVLQTWLNHIEGVTYRQNENARQRVTRVRSWLAYMSDGGVPTMDFAFLSDPSKLINWAHSLRNFAVTTQRIYISDVRSFLKFLLEARLDTVRASKKKLKGAIFSLDRLRRKLTSRLVVHKQAVKAKKSKNILDAVHIQTFLEKARRAIPNALVTLEQNPLPQNLYHLFGLLSGFIICLTGHRRGVLLGMEAEEVHAAPKDKNGRRVIMVAKHKTSSKYGHALVPLEKEEYVWFARFLYHRHKYPMGESKLFFANTNGGPFSRLAGTFQECWKEFGLPGKPTFGLIRTSISTYVGRELDYKQKEQVRRLMCHSTAVAEVFYEANQNLTDAFKSRRATATAVQKQTNNPREGREEDEDMHRSKKRCISKTRMRNYKGDKKYPESDIKDTSTEDSDDTTEKTEEEDEDRIRRKAAGKTDDKRDKKYPKRETKSTSVDSSDDTTEETEEEDDEDRISRKVSGKTDDKCDEKYPKRETEGTSVDSSDDTTEETEEEDDEDRISRKVSGKTDDKRDKKYPKRETKSTSVDSSDDTTEETEEEDDEDRISRKVSGKTDDKRDKKYPKRETKSTSVDSSDDTTEETEEEDDEDRISRKVSGKTDDKRDKKYPKRETKSTSVDSSDDTTEETEEEDDEDRISRKVSGKTDDKRDKKYPKRETKSTSVDSSDDTTEETEEEDDEDRISRKVSGKTDDKRDEKYPKRETEGTSVDSSDDTTEETEEEDDEDRISRKVSGKTDDKRDKKYPKRKTEGTSDDTTEETEDRIRRKGAGKTRKTDENSNKEIVVILDSNEEDQTQDKDKKDEQNNKDTSSIRKDDAGRSTDSFPRSLIFHSTNPPPSHRRTRSISQRARGKRLGTAWKGCQPITGRNRRPTRTPLHTLQKIGKCGRGNQSHKDNDKDEQHTDADMPGEGKDKTRNRTDTADGDKDEQQHADADMPSEGNETGHRKDTADGDKDEQQHADADMPREGNETCLSCAPADGDKDEQQHADADMPSEGNETGHRKDTADGDKDEQQHADADMPSEGNETGHRKDTADGDKDEQQHIDADMPSEGNTETGHRKDTADGDEDKEHVDADMPSEGKDKIKFTNETDGLNEMDMGCSTEKTDNHINIDLPKDKNERGSNNQTEQHTQEVTQPSIPQKRKKTLLKNSTLRKCARKISSDEESPVKEKSLVSPRRLRKRAGGLSPVAVARMHRALKILARKRGQKN